MSIFYSDRVQLLKPFWPSLCWLFFRSFPGIKRFSGVIEADVCESKGNEPENVIQGTDYTVYPKLLQE